MLVQTLQAWCNKLKSTLEAEYESEEDQSINGSGTSANSELMSRYVSCRKL